MEKIIEYIVVHGDEDDISELVMDRISDGYYPLGGICHDVDYPKYFQAMVKYEE